VCRRGVLRPPAELLSAFNGAWPCLASLLSVLVLHSTTHLSTQSVRWHALCLPNSVCAVPYLCSKDAGLLESVVLGLIELLRHGGDSGSAAAARAIKNLSAGHTNSNKVRGAARLHGGWSRSGWGTAGGARLKQQAP